MSAKISVALLGATGYTGLELIRLILRHPRLKIEKLYARQDAGVAMESAFPALTGFINLDIEDIEKAEACDCPVIFSALPHTASMDLIKKMVAPGRTVVDLSADYRLRDLSEYKKWYEHDHTDPGNLKKAVYGLPEWFSDRIHGATLIANPGCYPTATLLALLPLLKEKLVRLDSLIVDAKSGVSGAGKKLSATTHYCEANEAISAYKIGKHQHTPEIRQTLSEVAGEPVELLFTPHLVPMDRGILATCYADLRDASVAESALEEIYRKAYKNAPFTKVVSTPPSTRHVAFSNMCHVCVKKVGGRVVVLSAIDNLIKGASGQALQNLNIAKGWDETLGLI